MKKIRELNNPTSGLAQYRNSPGAKTNWDAFRDHNQGASHKKLIEKLIAVQHGLCGYCEINLTETDRQIEHVILEEEAEQLDGLDDPDKMNAWIRDVLIPDENGQLTPFFTTNRSYFDPLSESILAQPPQTWI